MVGVRYTEHWNPFPWYILGEVNTGCPSKIGTASSDRGERTASARIGGKVELCGLY